VINAPNTSAKACWLGLPARPNRGIFSMTHNTSTFTLPIRTAILVAAFDSQLKWARTIRSALE
jgi:hypothetical protein